MRPYRSASRFHRFAKWTSKHTGSPIAFGMAETIVQFLEIIDVAHQHGGTAGACSAIGPKEVEQLCHPAPVGNARQAISHRQPLLFGV